jgi:hypothetical protein
MSTVRSEDIPRPRPTTRPNLTSTLLARAAGQDEAYDAVLAELETVREQLRRAERKLAAIEALAEIDSSAIRAATTHTQLVCRASGYAFAEIDEPPPQPGEIVSLDGDLYVVERLTASLLAADPRRCAVLVRVA